MSGGGPTPRERRRARLEEELRENLKRRKEQARARRRPAGEEAQDARPADAPDDGED